MRVILIVADAAGAYEVAADSIFATAPTRRDGWWDLRTKAGREAARQLRANETRRLQELE